MKKLITLSMALMTCICLTQNTFAEDKIKINIATTAGANGNMITLWKDTLAPMINNMTGDKYEFAFFPAGALGNFDTIVEGVRGGEIHIAFDTSSNFANYCRPAAALDTAYLFHSPEEAQYFATSDLAKEMVAPLESMGLHSFGFFYDSFRLMFLTQEVKDLAGLKGLKIRSTPSKGHIATIRAMGAVPTPVAATEILSALQQGLVVGLDNIIPSGVELNFFDVCKYTLATNHFPVEWMAIANQDWYASLPETDRKAFDEAIEYFRTNYASMQEDLKNKYIKQFEGEIVFNELQASDYEHLNEITTECMKYMDERVIPWVEKIQTLLAEYRQSKQ